LPSNKNMLYYDRVKNYILTIELVPQTSWLNNVRAILSKNEWDKLKQQIYIKANYICEICGSKGKKHPVECHEIWEYDDINLVQKLSGMIALCPNCHMVKHIGLAQVQGKMTKAINHLKKINKISDKEANQYIKDSFLIWNTRSSKQWKVDTSILKSYLLK